MFLVDLGNVIKTDHSPFASGKTRKGIPKKQSGFDKEISLISKEK